MNLQSQITSILQKLNEPDCALSAEKEIKSLIVNQIDDGEKLTILINCISSESPQNSKKNKQLKLFISIAEIFQHQILEFLPKIFLKLNKKIKEGDLEMADIIADTYGGLIEYSFKGADFENSQIIFEECLKGLFLLTNNGFKNIQIIASMSITKIIQNCLIEILREKFLFIYKNLSKILNDKNTKSHFHILESILSLILSVQEQVCEITKSFPFLLINFIQSNDPKTRKICIDTFYTLCAIENEGMKEYHEELYGILQKLRGDKNKLVREAAMECLKVVMPPKKLESEERISNKRSVPKREKKKKVKKKKKASKIVLNKKINLDHVKSVIDKKKVNAKFLKNGISIDDQIFVKGEKNDINYDEFYEKNKKNLMEMKIETLKEKLNNKNSFGNPKKNVFEPLPVFDKTNNEPFMENFVVMRKGDSKRYLEKKESEKEFIRENSERILTPFEITKEDELLKKMSEKNIAIINSMKNINFQNTENPNNFENNENSHFVNNQNPSHFENIENTHNFEKKKKNLQKLNLNSQKNYNSFNQNDNNELKTLKKYIKILNGKFKDLNQTVHNLQNSNIYLSNKVNNLEKTLFNYSSFFQPEKKKNFQSFAEKYSENLSPSNITNNSNLPVLLFSQAQQNENFKIESSKWTKKKKNINDQLFDIFSSSQISAEKDFVTFLRSSENLINFKKIENSLLIKIFKRLTLLLNKNINGDILIIEYTLLWFKTFLDNKQPQKRELIQQLYTVLFLLVNTSYDENVKIKANLLLNDKFLLGVIKGDGFNDDNEEDKGIKKSGNNFFGFNRDDEEESGDEEEME